PYRPLAPLWIAGFVLLIAGTFAVEAWQAGRSHNPASLGRNPALAQREEAGKTADRTSNPGETVAPTPVTLEVTSAVELAQALSRPEGGVIILKAPLYEFSPAQAEGARLVIRQASWQVRPVEGLTPVIRFVPARYERPESVFCELLDGSLQISQT